MTEAFVEVNNPHVAVRMRRKQEQNGKALTILCDVGLVANVVSPDEIATTVPKTRTITEQWSRKPRISSDGEFYSTYFEIENLVNANATADKLKQALIKLGYTLTKVRFPV